MQDLDALRAHLERAYRDPTACVNIRVYSWRGEVLVNPVGPAAP